MNAKKFFIITALGLAAVVLLSFAAQATSYTWTGTTSNAWNLAGNWGGVAFPNAYTDQATIPYLSASPTVSLSTTALLGGGGTALTINTKSTTGTVNALDITSSGTLGMQGGISIGTRRTLTIEGILRNDAASSATTYAISGSPILNGGTITSQNGGIWGFTNGVTGYGTISAPFTGTVTANSNNQAMTITSFNSNPMTLSNPTLAFSSATGYYNLSNLNLSSGLTLSGTSGRSQFTNPLPGTFNNNWGNTAYGLINITGDTTISGPITLSGGYKVFNVVGSTLTLANNSGIPSAAGNTSAPPPFVVGAGGVVDFTGGNIALPTSAPIPLSGGTIENTGTGTFSAYSFIGNGLVSGVTSIAGGGNVTASGGTLTFATGGTGATLGSSSGSGANLNSSAGSTLDLKGNYTYINPGSINPGGGIVQLDGATLAAGTWSPTLNAGTINVTNNSFLTSTTGGFSSSANLGIGSGITLDASGATFVNNGTVTNNGGTALWGNFTNNGIYASDPSTQTFNTLTVGTGGYLTAVAGDKYQVKGNFINNSTQNTLFNTTQAELDFITGTSSAHSFALAGADLGQTPAGMTNNFAWGTMDLTGQTLTLADGNATPGAGLYVGKILGLLFSGTTVTDITGANGINIYYDPSLNLGLSGKTFNLEGGGILAPDSGTSPVPVPPSALLLGSGLLGLLALRPRKKEAAS